MVRRDRSRRLKWLDLHNRRGAGTVVWALVVGATGVVNTWADLVLNLWQYDQLAEMTAPYRGKEPLARLGSLDTALAAAAAATPDMQPSFVAWPRPAFSTPPPHAVFIRAHPPPPPRLPHPAPRPAAPGPPPAHRPTPTRKRAVWRAWG